MPYFIAILKIFAAALVIVLFPTAHALSATASDLQPPLSPQGKKPVYDRDLCTKLTQGVDRRQPTRPDEQATLQYINEISSRQLSGLWSLANKDVMWWIRFGPELDIVSIARAFHETNHTVDLELTKCNENSAAYYFDGQSYRTELKRGSIPPYTIAGTQIPAVLKSQPLGRYHIYFERDRVFRGNDLTILLDELNAHLTGAEVELALAKTPLYTDIAKSGKYKSYDGNIEGMADFMFYILCYLKAVEKISPESYKVIRNSPLFISHVQRLWTASERVLDKSGTYSIKNGGWYYISRDLIATIYSKDFIHELDKLGIRHASEVSVNQWLKN